MKYILLLSDFKCKLDLYLKGFSGCKCFFLSISSKWSFSIVNGCIQGEFLNVIFAFFFFFASQKHAKIICRPQDALNSHFFLNIILGEKMTMVEFFFPKTQCTSTVVRRFTQDIVYLLACFRLLNAIVKGVKGISAAKTCFVAQGPLVPARSVFVVDPQHIGKTCTHAHTHTQLCRAPCMWTEGCNYSHSVASAYAPPATSPSHYQK